MTAQDGHTVHGRDAGSGGSSRVWARSLLPPDDPTEVWLVDQGYTQHVVLTPGITADEVGRSWAPIAD